MLDRCTQNVSFLFGCVVCLVMTSGVNADGRVFLLDLKNSSGLQGFRDAERACATQHARLASAEELHHAVVECSFSPCTRGWLYGGTVGTTVCNFVGSALKSVDVRTENATEDTAHLDAFCVKDKAVPCGDPPSFPNARLQGHTGFEMGDELLYTCVPGHVMPSGHSVFSLLCDSCGEWYGMVQLCVKDETESHVDYEDKFTDAYEEAERHDKEERPEEAHGEVYEVVHGAAHPEEKRTQEQQEIKFSVKVGEEHQDQQGEEQDGGDEVTVDEGEDKHGRKQEDIVEGGVKAEERAVEDSTGHSRRDQEREQVARSDAAVATEAPVSLLSQKHLFWFPSEAFQGHPVSTNPVTHSTHKDSGVQSEESKEHESQETHYQHPVDFDDHDHERDSDDDHGQDDHDDDHDDSHHIDKDIYDKSRHNDRDDHENSDDSHQDQDDHDDHVKHYIPAQHDDLDRRGHYETHDDHDDHYDMGEHEDERDRVRYGNQGDYDDHDDDVEHHDHESYEDHDDVTDDHREDDGEHPEEHPDHDDHDDGEEHYDLSEGEDRDRDHYDHDDHDHDDHDNHDDHDDHDDHDIYDSHDDHDSHEDDDGHRHVIFPMVTDVRHNFTQKEEGQQQVTATTDETWLDGYPVVAEDTEKGDSKEERVKTEDKEEETVVTATDRPNEVEGRKRISHTSQAEVPEAPTVEPDMEQEGVEEEWPSIVSTAAPSSDSSEPSDPLSYPDTLDYDTQQAAPTQSWLGDLTEHPFLDHGPAPPLHDGDIITGTGGMKERTEHNLPGEVGERGEVEGERGETVCTGESCPPRPPSAASRGPTVAAIIVAVCAVATAVIVGAWCYRRQQQKSSVYEMNGKGQSQSRHGQQIEMQQKV